MDEYENYRGIQRALVANSIQGQVQEIIQGPHTFTYLVKIGDSTNRTLRKAERLSLAVENEIDNGPVRIVFLRGTLLVEVPAARPRVVLSTQLRGTDFAVPLGVTPHQNVIGIDFQSSPHLLVAGPTGQGKTVAMRAVAYHLAKQTPPEASRFIFATFKVKPWEIFYNMPNTWAVITNPQEVLMMTRYAVQETHQRLATGQDNPRVFIFYDDMLNLLSTVPELDVYVKELASLSREAGIHLIIGTQRVSNEGSGRGVAGNITSRLIFPTANAQDAQQFVGITGSGAEKIGPFPGDAILRVENSIQRVATGYLTNLDIENQYPAGRVKVIPDDMPWLCAPEQKLLGESPAYGEVDLLDVQRQNRQARRRQRRSRRAA